MKPLTPETAKLLAPIKLRPEDRLRIEIDETGKKFKLICYASAVDSSGEKRTAAASWVARSEFFQRLPERKQLSGEYDDLQEWEVGATDTTCTLIKELWPADQLRFADDARRVFDYIVLTAAARDIVADNYAKFKAAKIVPWHDVPMRADKPLAPHQQCALVNQMLSEGFGNFSEMGAGKTAPTITEICELADKMHAGTVDEVGLRRTRTMIESELESAISKLSTDADADAKIASEVKKKRAKLEAAARHRAERMEVDLDFHGSAQVLLQKARAKEVEVERWLSGRLAAIKKEMFVLESEYRLRVEAQLMRDEAALRAEAQAKIAGLVAERTPGRPLRAIIVCPKNVRSNWLAEFEGFATQPGNVQVIRGGPMRRVNQLTEAFMIDADTKYVVVIVSYDGLIKSWDVLGMDWDIAVTDEGHYYKNPNTTRFEYVMKLRDKSRRRRTLTGSPITNTPLDLYAQFEFMGQGYSGFTSWTAFKDFYGVYADKGGQTALVGVQNMPFMQERLARLSFQISKAEAMPDLPDKVYDVIDVEMGERQAEIYDKVATELAAELEDELDASNNKSLTVNCILTKLLRLAQITSGFVVWDAVYDPNTGEELRGGVIEHFEPDVKLEALVEELKTKGPDDKTIVWSCWVPNLLRIKRRLDQEGIKTVLFYGGTSDADREAAVAAYNGDPSVKVFVGNPLAGGTGLNLLGYPPHDGEAYTTNTTHEIYYSQNWSPTARWQSEDRGHRRGTRGNVRISDLMVYATIDELIRTRVLKKKKVAIEVSDIREVLQAVLMGVKEHE